MTERSFVDSNVFLYAFDSSSPYHADCHALVQSANSAEANLCISPQVFCEVYRYLTHPKAALKRDPVEVRENLVGVFSRPGIGIFPVPPDLTARIVALLETNPVRGARVFDVQIVATMLANGVGRIYTYNGSDFSYPGIEPITPPDHTATEESRQ